VQRLGPARAAVFNNLVPVFGAALAALLLGEPILVSMIVGGLVALAGVTLTNLPARGRAASSSEDPA
jgi:drug/metabolite transporter (DMT)-like permease